ncbi:MAG: DUF1501 domain-containing protein [Fimbriiglobus sp.]
MTRRDFLLASTTASLGFMAPWATGRGRGPGSVKAVVQIHLTGGPSQLDTFDPKPDAPSHIRGPFGTIPTRTPGVRFSELLPKLAGLSDKFTLIRSMTSEVAPVHELGLQVLNTGEAFGQHPAPHMTRSAVYSPGHLDFGMALDLGHGPTVTASQDLATTLRNLHEPRGWVTIYQNKTVFGQATWDCHAVGGHLPTSLRDYRETVCPSFDAALAEYLERLHQTGELAETLVVVSGEFGRTPRLNGHGGRDHWIGCWTALVAGGGIPGGQVIGASDADGAYPDDQPTTPRDLWKLMASRVK